jgi:hypothetical protein
MGNAVIAAEHNGELSPWEVVTDAGTTLRLNTEELIELFYEPHWLMNVSTAPGIRARAVLAQPEPEVAGPSDEEIDRIAWNWFSKTGSTWWQVDAWRSFARAILQRYATPQSSPVPVAERLPGPDDCDKEDICWWFDSYGFGWYLDSFQGNYTHWLPHNALPVPGAEAG